VAPPLVSIIIPCYNGEAFVGEAIESALAQTYPHREVIVIDDGSTDRSLDVTKSFGSSIRWSSGPNRGGSAARNTGLAMTTADYVQFLDADDVIHPEKISLQAAALSEAGGDVCVNRFRIIQDGLSTVGGPNGGPTSGVVDWFLRSDIRLSPLYRLSAVRRVGGFDERLPCCQDFDLNLRMCLRDATVVARREVLYEIRRRPGSVSSDEVQLYRAMVAVLSRAASQLGSTSEDRSPELRALAAKTSSAARWLLRLGDKPGALEAFAKAKDIHPSAGLDQVYSLPARAIRAALGPVRAEQALWRLRQIASSRSAGGNNPFAS
jgi:glycosyltransferase involved in cell wall biosynthesis